MSGGVVDRANAGFEEDRPTEALDWPERYTRLERELAEAKDARDAVIHSLQRDAKRYRWLRSHPVFQVKELPNELELLDASIDRYMTGQETEE